MGGPVDRRADIYATGCLAYWLLTGELVFTAENPIALIMRHANAPPEPPSSRGAAAIPRALDDLVLACLAKDPAHRPQSARELALRLAEVHGAVEWTQERAREWWTEQMEPALAWPPRAD
jgi:serine/threonine-protein kinase